MEQNVSQPISAYIYVAKGKNVEESITTQCEKMGGSKIKFFAYTCLSERNLYFKAGSTKIKGGNIL
jgi:hypothetical protein